MPEMQRPHWSFSFSAWNRAGWPPASGGFSAADGQAPSTAWAQLPRHGQRRGGQPPAPQPGAGLRPLAALPQLPSKSFLGPFLLHGPPAGPYLNSTWGLRMRPIHGRDPTPGVTPLRRPVPGEGWQQVESQPAHSRATSFQPGHRVATQDISTCRPLPHVAMHVFNAAPSVRPP